MSLQNGMKGTQWLFIMWVGRMQMEGGPGWGSDKHISHKKKSAQFTRKLRNYWKHETVEREINQSIEWMVATVGASFTPQDLEKKRVGLWGLGPLGRLGKRKFTKGLVASITITFTFTTHFLKSVPTPSPLLLLSFFIPCNQNLVWQNSLSSLSLSLSPSGFSRLFFFLNCSFFVWVLTHKSNFYNLVEISLLLTFLGGFGSLVRFL